MASSHQATSGATGTISEPQRVQASLLSSNDRFPIIIQSGRNMSEEESPPAPYVAPRGSMPDPKAKLAADEAIAAYNLRKASGIPFPPKLLELNEGRAPAEPIYGANGKKESSTKPRDRTSSSSASLRSFTTPVDFTLDAQPIYLTPWSKIPRCPAFKTEGWYRKQVSHPRLRFLPNGQLARDYLTAKIVQLFRDPETSPGWASAIPNIREIRAGVKGVDLQIDPWVFYWEALIVKADIRRGCKLAYRAAELLYQEKFGI